MNVDLRLVPEGQSHAESARRSTAAGTRGTTRARFLSTTRRRTRPWNLAAHPANWQSAATFGLTWANPPQATSAPIAGARYQICREKAGPADGCRAPVTVAKAAITSSTASGSRARQLAGPRLADRCRREPERADVAGGHSFAGIPSFRRSSSCRAAKTTRRGSSVSRATASRASRRRRSSCAGRTTDLALVARHAHARRVHRGHRRPALPPRHVRDPGTRDRSGGQRKVGDGPGNHASGAARHLAGRGPAQAPQGRPRRSPWTSDPRAPAGDALRTHHEAIRAPDVPGWQPADGS